MMAQWLRTSNDFEEDFWFPVTILNTLQMSLPPGSETFSSGLYSHSAHVCIYKYVSHTKNINLKIIKYF